MRNGAFDDRDETETSSLERCDGLFLDRDAVEWGEISSLSCGCNVSDRLSEERLSLCCEFDFDPPAVGLEEGFLLLGGEAGPSTEETGLLPVSMNVLDEEEGEALVVFDRELVPPLDFGA